MPAFARDRPPSSLLNPSLLWCCAAMLSEILPMNSSSYTFKPGRQEHNKYKSLATQVTPD